MVSDIVGPCTDETTDLHKIMHVLHFYTYFSIRLIMDDIDQMSVTPDTEQVILYTHSVRQKFGHSFHFPFFCIINE